MRRVLRCRSAVPSAVLIATLMLSDPVGAQPTDHLVCYKVKDSQAKATYTADVQGLALQFGCTIKVPAVMACVPAMKMHVTPSPPGGGGTGTPNTFFCYKVKCPKAPNGTKTTLPPLSGRDQFGSRTVTPTSANLLCAPLAGPITTTTTTTPPTCAFDDTQCMTPCLSDAQCPSTRLCSQGLCEPKLTDHRACLTHDDCLSDCCCGINPFTTTRGICREVVDCPLAAAGGTARCECPGTIPCTQDSDCCVNQFCTSGFCFQKQGNGTQCTFSSACTSACCCATSSGSPGQCADPTACTSGGLVCNP